MKTYSATPADIVKKWVLIDAEDAVLGRLAVIVADILRGKHKTTFTPHMDCGDNVVIVNAEKVHLTGKKRPQKSYWRHTGYPGGLKHTYAGPTLEGKHPERVITAAVKRMIPAGVLGRQILGNLKIYGGSQHPHEAQQPQKLDIAKMSPKNVKRVSA
ncbi:MAG: 50S ribosomal protein L13 [Alphaproteobacteria bacterium]